MARRVRQPAEQLLFQQLTPNSSITFERIPSDYAILKIISTPEDAGGDTLWASGYEAYDRLSPIWQKFAEHLTATHHQPNFVRVSKDFGQELIADDRGAPENNGLDFQGQFKIKNILAYAYIPL